jgi:hypothetical protein
MLNPFKVYKLRYNNSGKRGPNPRNPEISLPSNWVRAQSLAAGDQVVIYADSDNPLRLVLEFTKSL